MDTSLSRLSEKACAGAELPFRAADAIAIPLENMRGSPAGDDRVSGGSWSRTWWL